MENQQVDEQLSQEELAARKEEMMQFYTESVPYLEAQLKYEKLLADIDEYRLKRTQIQMQYAMMMQSQQPMEEEGDDEEDSKENEPLQTEAPAGRRLKRN
jgi:hypothetical protein